MQNISQGIGTLKIECKKDNNIIQIYNSTSACSLVINGIVVDQYLGVVATRFVLKGIINQDDKQIIVEAKR